MSNNGKKYKTLAKVDPTSANCSHSIMLGYVTKPAPLVLDVGCACGDLGVALKEHKGATVFGLEYSSDSIAIAKATGAYEDIRQCDIDFFASADVEAWKGMFDYVVCGDVLEHLRNPTRTLSELIQLLKPEGGIVASVPNIAHMYVIAQLMGNRFPYTPCGLLDETHIHFFTSEGIVDMLAQLGLLAKECRFTMCGKDEFNGLDPWGNVPVGTQKTLFSKLSSFVCQYVFCASRSDAPTETLKLENERALTITEANAPDHLLAERQMLLTSLEKTKEDLLQEELASLRNSRSWRLTKPLRFAGACARKIVHILHFLQDPSLYQLPGCDDSALVEGYRLAAKVDGLLSRDAIRHVYLMSGRRILGTCKYLIYALYQRKENSRWYRAVRSTCRRKATVSPPPPPHTHTHTRMADVIKPIALYLPQYHRIPENDAWWGKGFTEWTNVRKAKPFFKGHYQPHVPHPDIGYYDLSDVMVMRRQAALAKKYGLYGFCFYYYHFANGKRLLEKPIDNYLAAKEIDFPFCFCWANENWTRRWDGGENEVIMPQEYGRENLMKMFNDMLAAFKDPRYIKVGREKDIPVLLIYRAEIIPNVKEVIAEWRERAKADGFRGLYLIGCQNFTVMDFRELGLDASYAFYVPCKTADVHHVGEQNLCVSSYESMVKASWREADVPYPRYRIVTPSWDNSPRRGASGAIMVGATPRKFERHLEDVCYQTIADEKTRENGFVFINAWNEWGEGAHLEPDVKDGYAYLESVAKVMRQRIA